ncbi:MAG: hypothetical protein IK117_07940 [Bacteroidales bacterium]|nr:hypothetical protein [Bacteroidales bacterium]
MELLNCKSKIWIFILAIFLCGACDDYSTKVKKCMKEKWKSHSYGGFLGFGQKNDTPKDIDEALYKYDFETARAYLPCYGSLDYLLYKEKLIQINKAEISYLLNQGAFDKARNIIEEYGDYGDLYRQYILPKLIENKKYDEVFLYLYKISIPVPTIANCYRGTYHIHDDDEYNQEVGKYNSLVDILVNQAIATNDRGLAKRALCSYKEDGDFVKSSKTGTIIYKKSQNYLNAVQKLKAAGFIPKNYDK